MKKWIAALAALVFTLAPAQGDHQMRVTFTGYAGRTETLHNFPALVEFSDSSKPFYDPVNASDLRFFDGENNPLPHEIDSVANGKVLAWVKIPELLPDGSTHVLAVWGDDPGSPPLPASGVWSDDYLIVQHYNEPAGTKAVADASGNNNHGQIRVTSQTPVDGVIGRAVNLTATDGAAANNKSGIYMDNLNGFEINGTGDWTISAWFYGLKDTGDWRTLAREPFNLAPVISTHHVIIQNGSYALGAHISGFLPAGNAELKPGPGWRYFTAVGSGGQTEYYVDGVHLATGNFQADRPIYAIGFYQDNFAPPTTGSQQWSDYLDEFRVASAARGEDWIWAEVQNQWDPGAFVIFEPADASGTLRISGSPAGFGEADPPFDIYWPLATGSNFTATASQIWTNAVTQKTVAAVTGWEVWTNNLENGFDLQSSSMGTGSNACEYTHCGVEGKIVWHFAVSNKLESAPLPGGVVTGGGWCGAGASLPFEATPGEGFTFVKWAGNVPPGMALENPLELPGDEPRAIWAEFTVTQYVATDGNDASNGVSWASAKLTIQDAVDALPPSGGLVMVSNGWYALTQQVNITNAVEVRGWTGVSGDVHVHRLSDSYRIRIFKLDHPGAKLAFMTIRDGRCHDYHVPYIIGGNVLITERGGTVADCVLQNGQADNNGGHGGNVAMLGAAGRVLRSTLIGGNGVDHGFSLSMYAGRVEQCHFAGGSEPLRIAGGVVANCTITRCHSNSRGVVHAIGGAVRNCVIVDNTTGANLPANGGSVFCAGDQAGRFYNCVTDLPTLLNNGCTTTTEGFGFVDAPGNNYRLSILAFARGKGNASTAALESATDRDGNPVALFGAVDAGCYQYFGGGGLDFSFDAGLRRGVAPFGAVFSVLSENAAGDVTYTWDFGDNTPEQTFTTNVASFTLPHVFNDPGTHTVTVTATDGESTVVVTRAAFIASIPRVILVSTTGSAQEPYDTWDNSATSLRAAVDYAADGCTILIREGRYEQPANHNGSVLNVTKALRVQSEFDDPATVTITTGKNGIHAGRALRLQNADAWVSGLTLSGGWSDASADGKGVYIEAPGGTVSNCVITANEAGGNSTGAGAFLNSPGALLTHCRITGNHIEEGMNGQGVYTHSAHAVLYMTAGRVENCLVAGNRITNLGGRDNTSILELRGGTVRNCTFADNDTGSRGLVHAPYAAGSVIHCVLAGNTNLVNGARGPLWSGGNLRVTECTVDAVFQTALETAGNYTCRFGTPDMIFKNYAGKDYRLSSGSPAINAGPRVDPADYPAIDFYGRPRVLGGKIDHGCHEANVPGTLFLVR